MAAPSGDGGGAGNERRPHHVARCRVIVITRRDVATAVEESSEPSAVRRFATLEHRCRVVGSPSYRPFSVDEALECFAEPLQPLGGPGLDGRRGHFQRGDRSFRSFGSDRANVLDSYTIDLADLG